MLLKVQYVLFVSKEKLMICFAKKKGGDGGGCTIIKIFYVAFILSDSHNLKTLVLREGVD